MGQSDQWHKGSCVLIRFLQYYICPQGIPPMNIRVAKLSDDGLNWVLLGTYENYDDADDAVDLFSDQYPYACVDILDGALSAVQTI